MILQGIKSNSSLKSLRIESLGNNQSEGLGSEGAIMLSELLAKHCVLRELYLAGCEMYDGM